MREDDRPVNEQGAPRAGLRSRAAGRMTGTGWPQVDVTEAHPQGEILHPGEAGSPAASRQATVSEAAPGDARDERAVQLLTAMEAVLSEHSVGTRTGLAELLTSMQRLHASIDRLDGQPAPAADEAGDRAQDLEEVLRAVRSLERVLRNVEATMRQSRRDVRDASLDQAVLAVQRDLGQMLELRQRDLRELDELRQENVRLRGDYFRASLRPVLGVVLPVYDTAADLGKDDGAAGAALIAKQLEQALGQAFDAWLYRPQPGDPVDIAMHEIQDSVESTADSAPDTVHDMVRPGFRGRDGTVHRKAVVRIYR